MHNDKAEKAGEGYPQGPGFPYMSGIFVIDTS